MNLSKDSHTGRAIDILLERGLYDQARKMLEARIRELESEELGLGDVFPEYLVDRFLNMGVLTLEEVLGLTCYDLPFEKKTIQSIRDYLRRKGLKLRKP